jgi:phosphopantetheine adenylyltransferase
VKEIARYGGDIDKFVTPAVAADVAGPDRAQGEE